MNNNKEINISAAPVIYIILRVMWTLIVFAIIFRNGLFFFQRDKLGVFITWVFISFKKMLITFSLITLAGICIAVVLRTYILKRPAFSGTFKPGSTGGSLRLLLVSLITWPFAMAIDLFGSALYIFSPYWIIFVIIFTAIAIGMMIYSFPKIKLPGERP